MREESVHDSYIKERLAFEIAVNGNELLSLMKEIMETTRKLTSLSNRLVQTLTVLEEDKSR